MKERSYLSIINEVFGIREGENIEDSPYSRRSLTTALNTLEGKEAIVLLLHHVSGLSLKESGRLIGLTGNRISQIKAKAYRKLRHPSRAVLIEQFFIPNKPKKGIEKPKFNPDEKVLRNKQIACAVLEGRTYKEVGDIYGIGGPTVRRIAFREYIRHMPYIKSIVKVRRNKVNLTNKIKKSLEGYSDG